MTRSLAGHRAHDRYRIDRSLTRVDVHDGTRSVSERAAVLSFAPHQAVRSQIRSAQALNCYTTALSFAHHHIDPIKGERTQIDTKELSPMSRSGRRKGTTRVTRNPSRSSRSIPTLFGFDDQVLVVCCEGGSYKRKGGRRGKNQVDEEPSTSSWGRQPGP